MRSTGGARQPWTPRRCSGRCSTRTARAPGGAACDGGGRRTGRRAGADDGPAVGARAGRVPRRPALRRRPRALARPAGARPRRGPRPAARAVARRVRPAVGRLGRQRGARRRRAGPRPRRHVASSHGRVLTTRVQAPRWEWAAVVVTLDPASHRRRPRPRPPARRGRAGGPGADAPGDTAADRAAPRRRGPAGPAAVHVRPHRRGRRLPDDVAARGARATTVSSTTGTAGCATPPSRSRSPRCSDGATSASSTSTSSCARPGTAGRRRRSMTDVRGEPVPAGARGAGRRRLGRLAAGPGRQRREGPGPVRRPRAARRGGLGARADRRSAHGAGLGAGQGHRRRRCPQDGLDRRTSGIWELREPADLVSADIGIWLALDRAVWIARGWRPWTRRATVAAARDAAKARVAAALLPGRRASRRRTAAGRAPPTPAR